MASRQWTVVLMADDETSVRQFRLSREAVRITVALALFAFAGAGAIGSALVVSGRPAPEGALVERNEVLQRELDTMAARIDTLQGSLDRLAGRDGYYRLIAGLEPLDGDVLQAGIGGPDEETLESSDVYRIDRQAGTRAFTASLNLSTLIRRAQVLASSWSEAEGALRERNERLAATPSIPPTVGYVSSRFTSSRWHPLLDRPRPHMGIDIVAPTGTPVVATADGRVSAAAQRGHYGLLVEIDHGHGVVTRYAHLSRTAVRPGQAVKRGQTIGAVGTSGLSAGPHLHYEVLVHGRNTNPSRYILDLDVLPD